MRWRASLTLLVAGVGTTLVLYLSLHHLISTPSTPLLHTIITSISNPLALRALSRPDVIASGRKALVKQRSVPRKLDQDVDGASRSLRSIQIKSALPSTSDLDVALVRVWDDALHSLEATASSLAARALKLPIPGVPGTGIKTVEEAQALQRHLDCASGNGTWVYEGDGGERQRAGAAGLTVHKYSSVLATCDAKFYKLNNQEAGGPEGSSEEHWHVRESLKYRWIPSASCAANAPATPTPLSRHAFCTLLAHKATLLVGDVPHYSLHDLILDWTSMSPLSCYGDLYCKEHLLCADVLRSAALEELEDWTPDERVFNRLPLPPVKPRATFSSVGKKDKSPSFGTMLRYRRSDGLRASTQQTLPTYTHPNTSVREVNQPWMADARRSNLVILHKAPLPFPVAGFNATWDAWWAEPQDPNTTGSKIIEAAWRFTEDVWLPELLETLKVLKTPPTPADILIVYRGGWRVQPDCGISHLPSTTEGDRWNSPGDGPPPRISAPTLHSLLFRSPSPSTSTPKPRDVYSTFHNLQTIFQNHILRTSVLPRFGIPFLDLESSLSVWRSGLVGGSASPPFSYVDQSQHGSAAGGVGAGLRSGASGDCLRYCFPSPGMAIEEAFIGGLIRIFEEGWVTKGRQKDWIGDGFMRGKGLKKGSGSTG